MFSRWGRRSAIASYQPMGCGAVGWGRMGTWLLLMAIARKRWRCWGMPECGGVENFGGELVAQVDKCVFDELPTGGLLV